MTFYHIFRKNGGKPIETKGRRARLTVHDCKK